MTEAIVTRKLVGHARALVASRYVAEIAELLWRCQQEMDGYDAGLTWRQLPSLHHRVYRGKAEKVVIALDTLAEARAQSRMQEWCKRKLEHEFADDFNVFPERLVEAALDLAPSEYEHQLRRAFDELVGEVDARGVRVSGKCGACGGILVADDAHPVAACENCGYHERRTR